MFFKAITVAALAAVALAQGSGTLQITKAPSSVVAGKQYTIEWKGGSGGPATIKLREGESKNLKDVATLTTSGTNGEFTWTVDSSLKTDNDYALQITDGTETNYWAVSVQGSANAPTTTASESSASESSSSSSTTGSSSSTGTKSSASAAITSTRNSTTISSATLRSTRTTSASRTENTEESSETSSADSSATSAPSGNSGANLKSSAALVLGVVAAMVYLG